MHELEKPMLILPARLVSLNVIGEMLLTVGYRDTLIELARDFLFILI